MLEPIMIPEERMAVLIGKGGRTKAMIEKITGANIHIRDGVEVEGDPIQVLTARNIVVAIGRGFAPKDALLLKDEDYDIEVISLRAETRNTEKRIMARIIGKSGSAKKTIEDETGAKLAVYGKTVSIIGNADQMNRAREAVKLLIMGKTHVYVFGRLKKERF